MKRIGFWGQFVCARDIFAQLAQAVSRDVFNTVLRSEFMNANQVIKFKL
jgi:hypothetical protein